jgi:hypothetical protein
MYAHKHDSEETLMMKFFYYIFPYFSNLVE